MEAALSRTMNYQKNIVFRYGKAVSHSTSLFIPDRQ
jgi:hypothetical protein